MRVTIKDLETGELHREKDDGDGVEFGVFWWEEGNGSCDCNRSIIANKFDEMDDRKRKELPHLLPHQGRCFGCHRFIVVDVYGDLEGRSRDELIASLNREYKLLTTGNSK